MRVISASWSRTTCSARRRTAGPSLVQLLARPNPEVLSHNPQVTVARRARDQPRCPWPRAALRWLDLRAGGRMVVKDTMSRWARDRTAAAPGP